MTKVTDEMLMALADGELDSETAADVMRSVDADPRLQAGLADFRRTRALVRDAFVDVLSEEMPAPLAAAARRQRRRLPRWSVAGLAWRPLAGLLVASVVASFLVATLILGQGGTPLMPGDRELAAIFEASPSGVAQPWRGTSGTVQPMATYLVTDGVCRSFVASTDGEAWRGVACRRQNVWQVEIAVSDRGSVGDVFIPASDRTTQVIDAFLDVAGADQALDEAAEARLISNGWPLPPRGAE